MKSEAGGSGCTVVAVVSSVVGMGVSGAEVMAERLMGAGDAVVLIWVFAGLDMTGCEVSV